MGTKQSLPAGGAVRKHQLEGWGESEIYKPELNSLPERLPRSTNVPQKREPDRCFNLRVRRGWIRKRCMGMCVHVCSYVYMHVHVCACVCVAMYRCVVVCAGHSGQHVGVGQRGQGTAGLKDLSSLKPAPLPPPPPPPHSSSPPTLIRSPHF